ncbi:MAG: SDR family oxidoreductase [Actinomycetota bacterium]|nr:SDR family oxidoreductase [Actinomycetota bacterium]
MVDREIVVVTGASAGVGRAVARRFGETGAAVALLARGRDGLEAAAKEIQAAGGTALVVPTDVAEYDQVEAAAAEVEDRLGPIDIWVNNAMTTVFARFWDVTAEEFRRATDVTYHGVVYGTFAALERMRPRDRGTIVQVGSALAYRGIPLQSAYCGAKHAIVGFTDALRCELVHDKSSVHLTAVHLPALNTPQFSWCRSRLPRHPQPVKPIYQPEVAAEAIWWAAHQRRREVWVGAPTVGTILANRFIPGLLDRYLGRTGVDGQQTDQPVDPDRPDDLFEPVPGDHGAHGIFDQQAKGRSVQLWATQHRPLVVAGAAAAAGGLLRAARRR